MIDPMVLTGLLMIAAGGGFGLGALVGHTRATEAANEREAVMRTQAAHEERDHADRWLAYMGDAYPEGTK